MMLVTGFGPFDIFSHNPTQIIAQALSEEFGCDHRILPVVFGKARDELVSILDDLRPDRVICFGLNGTISHIALETLAVNIRHTDVPDNEGRTLDMAPVDPEGPLALRSTLPMDRILAALRDAGIPARYSFSAGTYLCNEAFYTLMQYCERTGAKGGFVHVPLASHMASPHPRLRGGPHMSMEMILESARIATRETLR